MMFDNSYRHKQIFATEIVVAQNILPRKSREVVRKPIQEGHKLYEFNMRTMFMDEVRYTKIIKHYLTGLEVHYYNELPWCKYVPALNENLAFAKFNKAHKAHLGIEFEEIN